MPALRVFAVLGYGLLFAWHFACGLAMGNRHGFMLYAPLALYPSIVAGGPWLWLILETFPYTYLQPRVSRDFDLTVLSDHTLIFHALVLASFALNLALIFMVSRWYERRALMPAEPAGTPTTVEVQPTWMPTAAPTEASTRDAVRVEGADPTRRTGTGDFFRAAVLVGYGAIFVWQFVLGSAMGKEAGFALYFPLGLFPAFVAGSPWSWVLLAFPNLIKPNRGFDLTVFSTHTVLYHALVLASFAINVALIFKFLAWSERQAARSGGEGIAGFASREEYEAWKAGQTGEGSPSGGGGAGPK
jgi:hypothetical protein